LIVTNWRTIEEVVEMISITVSKEDVKTPRQFESNRYKLEVTQDCDDPNRLDKLVSETFALIRKHIEEQKRLDGYAPRKSESDKPDDSGKDRGK
jgi:hypothetical protein